MEWCKTGNGEQVPVGEVGEIVVSGPNVMMGYWKQAEEDRSNQENTSQDRPTG